MAASWWAIIWVSGRKNVHIFRSASLHVFNLHTILLLFIDILLSSFQNITFTLIYLFNSSLPDESNGWSLSIDEMQKALDQARAKGVLVRWVGFVCCIVFIVCLTFVWTFYDFHLICVVCFFFLSNVLKSYNFE
jgi:hypothetical protein